MKLPFPEQPAIPRPFQPEPLDLVILVKAQKSLKKPARKGENLLLASQRPNPCSKKPLLKLKSDGGKAFCPGFWPGMMEVEEQA